MPDQVTLRDSEGRAYGVPQEHVASYVAQGFRPETSEEGVERTAADAFHEEHGGVGGALTSGVVGGLSGLTLGGSDVALGALGAGRTLQHLEAEHPYAAGGGQVAGALLPTVLTGGAAAGEEAAGLGARILAHSPAGLAGRVGGAIGGVGEGAGLVGRLAAGTAGAAAEGALYGGGQYLTETALEDKPLSAEGFVAGMGHGALFAAPIGAAGTLAGATLQRARSLFPRSEVSAAAAAGVKGEATSALGQAVRDGDTMAQAAERKLSDVDARAQMAEAGETVTRRVFGEAHPQALADQVTGAVDRQQVTQALEGYQQARQQLEDWVASEADQPDLEAVLSRLDPAARMRQLEPLAQRGDAAAEREYQILRGVGGLDVQRPPVAPGEFGEPGVGGFKSQDELGRLAAGTGREEGEQVALASADATGAGGPRALRGGALGTPAGEIPAQDIVQRGMAGEGTAAGRRPAGAPEIPARAAEPGLAADAIARHQAGVSGAFEGGLSTNAGGHPQLSIDAQRQVRGELSGLAEKYGLHHRLADADYGDSVLIAHPGESNPDLRMAFDHIPGQLHNEDSNFPGLVSITPDQARLLADHAKLGLTELRALGQKAASGDESAVDSVFAGHVMNHETIHGFGPRIEPDQHKSIIEELTTELAARRITGDVHGVQPHTVGTFGHIVDPAVDAIAKASGASKAEAYSALERSALDFKRRSGTMSSDQAIHDVMGGALKHLGNEDPTAIRSSTQAIYRTSREVGVHPAPVADVPEYAAIKAHEAKADDYLEQSVPARKIAARGYYEPPGGNVEDVRVANAKKAIAEGQRDPIKLNVSESGKITVTDGRHRLAAAIEADAPIKVKWSTGTEPAASDVLRGARAAERASAEPAADDLLGKLQGTAAKIDEGQTIGRIGAESPARAEYVGANAEGTAAAAEHFRGKALAARAERAGLGDPAAPWNEGFGPTAGGHEGSRMAAEEHAARAERVGRRAGVGDAAQRYRIARPEPAPGSDPLAAFGLESDPTRLAGAHGGEVPAEVRAMALPERTAVDTGIKARMGGVRDEAAIAKAIMRHNGKGVDIGPSLARAAKAIGDMEDASAKLADVLGTEAPATAVENATAYRAALRGQQDRAAASAAKTAADLKTKLQPAADATIVDDDVTKALRQHDARATAQAGKAASAAAPAPSTATPAAAPEAPAAGSSIGGRLADVGSALEVLRAIGAHVPALSHIPVIGPILGLWLKARAVMGILGRKGGSIGKSTEGLIASKSAATRDRLVAATGALLEGGARAAGKVAHLAGPAVLLADALFPGGDKPASDRPRDLFDARTDDIVRAQQPGAIDQAIAQRYPTSDPAMHDAIVAQVQRGITFLDGKRPKQTVLPGVLPGDGTWKPSTAAIDEFGKYVHAVNDPVSVFEDLAKGHPSAEGAETLRVVYPELYRLAQKELLQAAPAMARTLPYSRRVMISILYQIPVDGTMQPSHAQYLQAPAPPSAAPRAPATAGPLKLGQQTMSPLDQRASGA